MSVVYVFRERARGHVSSMMVLWALAMTVVLFIEVVNPSAEVIFSGFGISAILGIYLGWRRRVGAVVVAPVVNWLFAWLPMEIACMIHFGVLDGFFIGLLVITFGWAGIGFVEFVWISMVALLVRALRGTTRDEPVVIIDPEKS